MTDEGSQRADGRDASRGPAVADDGSRKADRGGSPRLWAFVSVLFALGAVGTTVLASGALYQDVTRSPGSLAGILLAGAITFILAIGGLVALFHALGLTNRQYPLGLPDGTVQALIALILVLLFFIMAVFLYLDVSQTTTDRRLNDLSKEAVAAIPAGQIVAQFQRDVIVGVDAEGNPQTETRFDVLLASPRASSDVAQEIARQLITSLGTLIAAIAAFYFGAKAVGGAPVAEDQTRSGVVGKPG